MPKKLRTSLRASLSKLKKIPNPMTTNSLLSACKYPKTPPFAATDRHDTDDNNAAATLPEFLHESTLSLYLSDEDQQSGHNSYYNFAIKASARFFVSACTSNSLADEACVAVPGDSVAVVKLSKDPYDDFLRSMKDMINARHARRRRRQTIDWEFMEELLFCYLKLNDESVHDYIMKAFTDLMVSFQYRNVPVRRKVVCRDPAAAAAAAAAKGKEKVKDCSYERSYVDG